MAKKAIEQTLEQLYIAHRGKVSDKWSIYLREYDRLFQPFRRKPARLLEIGIQNGGSLDIWAKYFTNATKIVGCDINPECGRLNYKDPRISVVVGNANSDEAQSAVLAQTRNFDLIIDDGSHRSSDIVKSFARYFPHLSDGGIFIVEDLHCSYWQEYEGGLYDPFSSMAFLKKLADVISHEHWGVKKASADIFAGFFAKYGFHIDGDILGHIHSVEFINSMCVIRKLQPEKNILGPRLVTGSVERVFTGLRGWRLTESTAPLQTNNVWSMRNLPPEDELPLRLNDLTERDSQIASLSQSAADRENQIAALNQATAERDNQIASLTQIATDRESQVAALNQSVAERDGQIAALNQATAERDNQIASLTQIATDRESQVAALNQSVAERDGQIAALNQATAERDNQIASLTQIATDRESQVAALNQSVAERDGQIAALNQATAERDNQIASLTQIATDRERQIAALNQSVAERGVQITAIQLSKSERDDQIADLKQEASERDHQISNLKQVATERERLIPVLNQLVSDRESAITALNQALVENREQLSSVKLQLDSEREARNSLERNLAQLETTLLLKSNEMLHSMEKLARDHAQVDLENASRMHAIQIDAEQSKTLQAREYSNREDALRLASAETEQKLLSQLEAERKLNRLLEQEIQRRENLSQGVIAGLRVELEAQKHATELRTQEFGYEIRTIQNELNLTLEAKNIFSDRVLAEQKENLRIREELANENEVLQRIQESFAWRMLTPLHRLGVLGKAPISKPNISKPGNSLSMKNDNFLPRRFSGQLPNDRSQIASDVSFIGKALRSGAITNSLARDESASHDTTNFEGRTVSTGQDFNYARLMQCGGRDFIEAAYKTLLKRLPDDDGLSFYLSRLHDGANKVQILFEIFASPECREAGVEVLGLREAFAQEGFQLP